MATLFLAPAAERDIRKLDPPVQKKVQEELTRLAENPHLGKPLYGVLKGYFSHDFRSSGSD